MSLRRKGSRPITVDDIPYRWTTRHKPTYAQGLGHSPMTVAVQHGERPGSVLVMRLPHAHPGNWLLQPSAAVTPARVASAIREALTRGWQPECPGGPFHLDLSAAGERRPREDPRHGTLRLTDEAIEEAERLLAVKFPADLIDLLHRQNGDAVASDWDAFPTSRPTSWSADHVPLDHVMGIGRRERTISLLDTPYLVEEWGLPLGVRAEAAPLRVVGREPGTEAVDEPAELAGRVVLLDPVGHLALHLGLMSVDELPDAQVGVDAPNPSGQRAAQVITGRHVVSSHGAWRCGATGHDRRTRRPPVS